VTTYKATYRESLSARVGDEPTGRDAPTRTVTLAAESLLNAELGAQRLAAAKGWTLLDVTADAPPCAECGSTVVVTEWRPGYHLCHYCRGAKAEEIWEAYRPDGFHLGDIADALAILDACYRQACLSNGAWKCYYWRRVCNDLTCPAPWYVDPAEFMAEQYHTARTTLYAIRSALAA